MSTRIIFEPKISAGVEARLFDFTSQLAVGETLVTPTVTVTVYSGVDASPLSMLSGSATVSGKQIRQLFTGGTAGVIYDLRCGVTTSAGQTLEQTAYLAVVPNLP